MSTTQQADYSAALFPDTHRVCGLRMMPHTLGHALLLRRVCNPYAIGGEAGTAGLGHTVAAAFICSRPWEKAAVGLDAWWIRAWIRIRSSLRWNQEIPDKLGMLAYLSAAWQTPKAFRRDRGGAQRGSDQIQILLTWQRRNWGKSMDAAMGTPVAVALMEHMERLEEEGVIRLWGDRDSALHAKLDEMEARRKASPTTNAHN